MQYPSPNLTTLILKMKRVAVIFLMLLTVVSMAATPGEAVSCSDIQGSLYPCLSYLTSGGEPTDSCCSGVRSVVASLQSQQDRQTACYCLKSSANSFTVQPDAAANLPGKCGVSVGMTVTPDVDCSQVS